MRRADAKPRREQFFGVAVAPAQEVDDVQRAEFTDQLGATVGFRAPHRLFEQRERFEAGGNIRRPVDDFADADDDGNAVFGEGGF